jgi:hypothetical protein
MNFGGVEVVLTVWAVGLVAWTVAVVVICARRRATVGRVAQDFDAMKAAVDAWERAHWARLQALDRHIREAERSTGKSEAAVRIAGHSLRDLRYDVRQRLEAIEGTDEIDRLVTQGRIAPDHSPSSSPLRHS